MHLSKSKFTAGYQCDKLLWWTVHEPGAKELEPDKVLLDLFDQGKLVDELARKEFRDARFQVSVEASDVRVIVDVLEGDTLIEVKSSNGVKDEHIPDAAVQVWVLRQAGMSVRRAEIMHLNPDYRHPGPASLFSRTDVTERVEEFLPRVPGLLAEFSAALGHDAPPARTIGAQCFEPRDCAFQCRCWPDDVDHIRHLCGVGEKKTVSYMASGVHRIGDLPANAKISAPARRQIRAMQENRLIVEPTLAAALAPFQSPLGFLDFETVARAVPVWDGLAPWGQAAAQFSYHEERGDGTYTHVGWLAEGPGDPRRDLAQAMVDATAGSRSVVVYTSFEKTRIRELQRLVPEYAEPLEVLLGKLVDLHPVMRDNVYHPDFQGSFSLKDILTPMVPELTYDDLVIVDGRVASVEIARLLFVAHKIPPAERDRIRKNLLDYCERDTFATVRLMERLRLEARTLGR